MKKIYLVHCWGGTTQDGWYPWLKKKLSKNNIELICYDMPNTEEPTILEWTSFLDSKVQELNSDTYFIGHSIGCQTILRYLEKKETKKIGGIILVAPWLDLIRDNLSEEELNVVKRWIYTPINFDYIKKFTNNITCIFSDNDYFVSLNNEMILKEVLAAKTVIVHDKGHISKDDGVNEADFILNEVLLLTKEEK